MIEKTSTLKREFQVIKSLHKENINKKIDYNKNIEERKKLEDLSYLFLGKLSSITVQNGYDVTIEGIHLDMWKSRIWGIIEDAGLMEN